MPFWNNVKMEPYRGFRWKIEFKGIKHAYYAMKCDKPSFKIGEYTHKFLNHSFFFPGRVEWNPVTITVVDAPGGAAQELYKQLVSAGYAKPTNAGVQQGEDGLTKQAATNSFATGGVVTITQLRAKAGVIEAQNGRGSHETGATWSLNNAWVQDVKFGSLDYSNEDAVTIDITLRYDWAETSDKPEIQA